MILKTAIVGNSSYFRLSATTSNWMGISFGPSLVDGMTGGDANTGFIVFLLLMCIFSNL